MNELERQFSQEVVPLFDTSRMEEKLPQVLRPLESRLPTSDEELERWRAEHGQ